MWGNSVNETDQRLIKMYNYLNLNFTGDMVDKCYRLRIQAGQTVFIPTGIGSGIKKQIINVFCVFYLITMKCPYLTFLFLNVWMCPTFLFITG